MVQDISGRTSQVLDLPHLTGIVSRARWMMTLNCIYDLQGAIPAYRRIPQEAEENLVHPSCSYHIFCTPSSWMKAKVNEATYTAQKDKEIQHILIDTYQGHDRPSFPLSKRQ